MTRSGAFCPRCGDPVESDPGERPGSEASDPDSALCDDCYFAEFDLVDAPDRIEVRVCSQCGAVHRGNRWVDVGAEDYTDVAVDVTSERLGVHVEASEVSWQVAPEQVDRNTIRMHSTFSGVVRGTALTEEVVVPVKIARETCQRCGRIAGGSFASVVQVRAVDRTPTDEEEERAEAIAREVVAEMEATGDRDAFVTDVGSVDAGLDIKVSTTKIGQQIAKRLVAEFGGSFSDSERLITEDEDGEAVYRVTYAVRLPPYTPGDIIDPEDGEGPVLVRSVQGNLKGTRLESGAAYEASFEAADAPDATRLGTYDDGVDTTLVAVEDAHAVQVLDPETYETKAVPRPAYLDSGAETVRVLKSRAGLHVLPPD